MSLNRGRVCKHYLSETFQDGLLGNAGDFVARMDDRGRAAMEVDVSPPSLFDLPSSALL
jgi:hypothetical protein